MLATVIAQENARDHPSPNDGMHQLCVSIDMSKSGRKQGGSTVTMRISKVTGKISTAHAIRRTCATPELWGVCLALVETEGVHDALGFLHHSAAHQLAFLVSQTWGNRNFFFATYFLTFPTTEIGYSPERKKVKQDASGGTQTRGFPTLMMSVVPLLDPRGAVQ